MIRYCVYNKNSYTTVYNINKILIHLRVPGQRLSVVRRGGVSRPCTRVLTRHRKPNPNRVPGSCGDSFLGGGEFRAFCWLSWSHALTGISLAVA